jgi:hypothetical protein
MLKRTLLLSVSLVAPLAALKLEVSGTAGAASSPLMYGIMFEVSFFIGQFCASSSPPVLRTSTIQEMAASMPN